MKQQADDARHEEHRDEHRHQRDRNRNNGEADLSRAAQGGSVRLHALLDVPHDVFEHHDGVVDHQTDRQGDAEQRDVVQAVAKGIEQRDRTDQRDRNRRCRNKRRDDAVQEQEDDQHHQQDCADERELDVVHGLANRQRAVVDEVDFDRLRQLCPEARHQRAHRVDHLHGVGVRLALHRERNRTLAIEAARRLDRLEAVFDGGHFVEPHRCAVTLADDQLGEVGGLHQLLVGLNGQRLARAVEYADGRVGVGRVHGLGQFVERDVARVQQIGIGFHAHRERLAAVHADLRHAVDGRERGRDQVLGVIVEFGRVHRRRNQRDEQHRGVGRIHFAVRRQLRELDRQLPLRAQQRSLHVHRRSVYVTGTDEFEGERGYALRVDRADGLQARNGRELLFERQGDRRRHGVGACPR